VDGEKSKLRLNGGCLGLSCYSRARRWWHASYLWLGRGERVGKVAVNEEEQWRSSAAFEQKKRANSGSGQAHGQERCGGGGGELGERRVGRGLRRLLHMMPDVSGRAGPVSGARQRSQGGEKQGRAWATVGQLGRWLLGRPNRIVTFLIYSNFQTDLNLV
jgi:hypothetical protein